MWDGNVNKNQEGSGTVSVGFLKIWVDKLSRKVSSERRLKLCSSRWYKHKLTMFVNYPLSPSRHKRKMRRCLTPGSYFRSNIRRYRTSIPEVSEHSHRQRKMRTWSSSWSYFRLHLLCQCLEVSKLTSRLHSVVNNPLPLKQTNSSLHEAISVHLPLLQRWCKPNLQTAFPSHQPIVNDPLQGKAWSYFHPHLSIV